MSASRRTFVRFPDLQSSGPSLFCNMGAGLAFGPFWRLGALARRTVAVAGQTAQRETGRETSCNDQGTISSSWRSDSRRALRSRNGRAVTASPSRERRRDIGDHNGAEHDRRPRSTNSAGRGWAGQDSNLQPDRYERPALTIELPAPTRNQSSTRAFSDPTELDHTL